MGAIQRLYDFISGTRISSQQVDEEFDQLVNESNLKETRISNLESGKVPYTGATKDLDMNGKSLLNLILLSLKDAANDGYYFSLAEDGTNGNAILKSRTTSDGLPFADVLSITKDGIISFPTQSMVYSNSSGTQLLNSGVDTKITILTSKVIDTQNEFANSRFTAKQSGNYAVRLFADFSTSIPAGEAYLKLFKNGSAYGTVDENSAVRILSSIMFVQLNVGDYIEFYISQNSSGTAKTLASASMQVAKFN